jgi:hypothetical protein
MDDRPVLIGMNNPLSADPRAALLPHPARSSGWRLWKCAHNVSGMTRAMYLRAFDRRNLLNSQLWDEGMARRWAPELWAAVQGRTVVVLGAKTRDCLDLPDTPLCRPQKMAGGGSWRWVPHPSGRSHWYNLQFNRTLVGVLLSELADVPETAV